MNENNALGAHFDADAIVEQFSRFLQEGDEAVEYIFDDDLDDAELAAYASEYDDPTGKLFTVYGWGNVGKTTFLEQVIAILSARGLRVGVIKHHGHSSPLDPPGKDSYRYAKAGAVCEVVSSAKEYLVHRNPLEERTLLELALEIEEECDIILAEGFKNQAINPIELYRVAAGQPPIANFDALVAMITDSDELQREAEEHDIPAFGLDDHADFANFLVDMTGWRD